MQKNPVTRRKARGTGEGMTTRMATRTRTKSDGGAVEARAEEGGQTGRGLKRGLLAEYRRLPLEPLELKLLLQLLQHLLLLLLMQMQPPLPQRLPLLLLLLLLPQKLLFFPHLGFWLIQQLQLQLPMQGLASSHKCHNRYHH